MKTKIFLTATLLAIATTSCTKETNGGSNLSTATEYSGYLINAYIDVDDYESVSGELCKSNGRGLEDYYGELPENTHFALGLKAGYSGDVKAISRRKNGETNPEFIEHANKNGEYGTYEELVSIGGSASWTSNISNIQIWAVNDFNENYPAGSELSDIARITYSSFQPFIDNNYEQILPDMLEPGSGGTPRLKTTYVQNAYSYYNVELPKEGENTMVTPSVSHNGNLDTIIMYFGSISFTEASVTTTPEYEVCVTFEDGREFRGSFSVDLEYEYYFEE